MSASPTEPHCQHDCSRGHSSQPTTLNSSTHPGSCRLTVHLGPSTHGTCGRWIHRQLLTSPFFFSARQDQVALPFLQHCSLRLWSEVYTHADSLAQRDATEPPLRTATTLLQCLPRHRRLSPGHHVLSFVLSTSSLGGSYVVTCPRPQLIHRQP